MIKDGDEQVPEDNQRERAQLENKEKDDAYQQYQIACDVHAAELEILELQRNHVDGAHQQNGEKDGKEKHHPKVVEVG